MRVFVRVYAGYASLCLCFDVVLAVNFIAKYYNTQEMIYVSVIVYMCTNERSVLIHFIAIVLSCVFCVVAVVVRLPTNTRLILSCSIVLIFV